MFFFDIFGRYIKFGALRKKFEQVKSGRKKKKVAVVLPNNMVVRSFCETKILPILQSENKFSIDIITSLKDKTSDSSNVKYLNIYKPCSPISARKKNLGNLVHKALVKLIPGTTYGSLVFRFNYLNKFIGHRHKMQWTKNRRQELERNGKFVEKKWGKPFPHSRLYFKIIKSIYYSLWQENNNAVVEYFDKELPNLLVLYTIQCEEVFPYWLEARKRKIPIVGIVGSWDQPTTKGSILPELSCYLVQSNKMKEELIRYHKRPKSKIIVTGWPQMDSVLVGSKKKNRDDFLRDFGIPLENKVILYAAYGPPYGDHEPLIVNHLVSKLQEGFNAESCSLIIRPHPWDDEWEERFKKFHNPPDVFSIPPSWGELDLLGQQLKHSDVMVSIGGTMPVEAAGLDTCAIIMGVDGNEELPFAERRARAFEQDHYAPVIESGGVKVAYTLEELDCLLKLYLNDPGLDKESRLSLRREQLEPMDGKTCKRIANVIIDEVGRI